MLDDKQDSNNLKDEKAPEPKPLKKQDSNHTEQAKTSPLRIMRLQEIYKEFLQKRAYELEGKEEEKKNTRLSPLKIIRLQEIYKEFLQKQIKQSQEISSSSVKDEGKTATVLSQDEIEKSS